ncbi:hypothetical protein HZS38_07695 [Xenorhabdus nematophila]|uniref:hypothetical protein n=1 Tax=Xenorhabdus nematophila TaxID=628 RepID=UPI0005444AC0|nr:hypothetical protein [Xenorhabdus nematophila]CEF32536.1 hypothetical protein XNW1_4370001 [Xenorhabdus nematophila str. Websteri]AYA40368.1 hypothetical protein D3790_07805 [Xenorhabdus nematophila]MBA0019042.1 hypothetical protein [Xenorhabdus nematophila]MCB4426258.1 hypothetical protein [Xenorhabdus nematophila]QNJ38005.1 hypothetical protein H8F46_07665 [Xenorhabdus nematophila]
MIDRKIYNTSNYDIEFFAQGTAGSKYGSVTIKPGQWEWVFIEGNELFTLVANIKINEGKNSSVIFSQELKARPGGYLYKVFNKKGFDYFIHIFYDPDFFELTVT